MNFCILYKAYTTYIALTLISYAPKSKWAHILQTPLILQEKKVQKIRMHLI